jgi:uncharacterized protein YndB with AHSA1/START domain
LSLSKVVFAQHHVGTDETGTTVEVSLPLSVPVNDAWRALTEPQQLRQWLGTLSPGLQSGGKARLEFGDGDFFELDNIQLSPPFDLQYDWRFLGVGPLNTIRWNIQPLGTGSLLTLTDAERHRLRETAAELCEGWKDFTQRLKQFLLTNKPTRYDWGREFKGWVEIKGSAFAVWESLFESRGRSQWLLLDKPELAERAHLRLEANDEHDIFLLDNIVKEPPQLATFEVLHPDWLSSTKCDLRLTPYGSNQLLSITHVGWESISRDSSYCRRQRTRFAVFWTAALRRASRSVNR